MAGGRMRDGTGMPRAVSLCSAALRVEYSARMVRRPPQGQRRTSVPKGALVEGGPIKAPLRLFLRWHFCPWPRRDDLRLGLAGGERPERGVGGQDSMKTRQVKPRRRHQRYQPPHEGLGRQGEGDSFLGRVLVAAIVEPAQA